MAKKQQKFPLSSLLILLGLISLFIALSKNDIQSTKKYQITKISILGNSLIPTTEIEQIAKKFVGDSLDRDNLFKLKRALEEYPFIDEAVVKVDAPSRLIINVKEFSPVAVLMGKKMFYLNEQGQLYPYRFLREYKDLIIFTGKQIDQEALIRNGLFVLQVLKQYPLVEHMVSEIHFENRNPYLILVTNAIQVKLDKEALHQNMVYLEEFLKNYGNILDKEKVKSINLTFSNKIFISQRGLL